MKEVLQETAQKNDLVQLSLFKSRYLPERGVGHAGNNREIRTQGKSFPNCSCPSMFALPGCRKQGTESTWYLLPSAQSRRSPPPLWGVTASIWPAEGSTDPLCSQTLSRLTGLTLQSGIQGHIQVP